MTQTALTASPFATPLRPWYLAAAACALAVMIAAILSPSLWFLNFVHVISGALWTGIDLFMGFVIGPVLRRVSLETRRAMIAACRKLAPVGSSLATQRSSLDRTSRCTTHARSRTSRISRNHSAVIARQAQGRSSSDLGRRDVIVADHCPMGTTLSRHPLVRPAPTQLLLAADSMSRSSRKATRNMQPRRTRKPPPQVAEDERS